MYRLNGNIWRGFLILCFVCFSITALAQDNCQIANDSCVDGCGNPPDSNDCVTVREAPGQEAYVSPGCLALETYDACVDRCASQLENCSSGSAQTNSLMPYSVKVIAEVEGCGSAEQTTTFTGDQTPPLIMIHGEVLNRHGKGVENARIKLIGPSGELLRTGISEGRFGRFTLKHKLDGSGSGLVKELELQLETERPTTVTVEANGYKSVVKKVDQSLTNASMDIVERGMVRDRFTETPIAGAEITFECNGSQKSVTTDSGGSFDIDWRVNGCCSGHKSNDAVYLLEKSLQVKVVASAPGHSPEEKKLTFSTHNLPDLLTVKGTVYGGKLSYPGPLEGARVSIELPTGEIITDKTDERGNYEMSMKAFLTSGKERGHQVVDDQVFKLKPTRLSASMSYRPAKLGINCKAFPDEPAIVFANHHVPVKTRLFIELDGSPVEKGSVIIRPLGFYQNDRKIGYVWHRFPGPMQANVRNGWTDEIKFDPPSEFSSSTRDDQSPVYGKLSIEYDDRLIGPNTYEAELDYLVLSKIPTIEVTSSPEMFNDGEVDFSRTFDIDIKSWGKSSPGFDVSVKAFDGDVYFYNPDNQRMFNSYGQRTRSASTGEYECFSNHTAKFSLVPRKRSVSISDYIKRPDIDLSQFAKNMNYLHKETLAHVELVEDLTPGLTGTGWVKAPGNVVTGLSAMQLGLKATEIYMNDELFQRIMRGELGKNKYEVGETAMAGGDLLVGVVDVGMGFANATLKGHFAWQAFKANYELYKLNYQRYVMHEAYSKMIDEWVPLMYQPVVVTVENEDGKAQVTKQIRVFVTKSTTD